MRARDRLIDDVFGANGFTATTDFPACLLCVPRTLLLLTLLLLLLLEHVLALFFCPNPLGNALAPAPLFVRRFLHFPLACSAVIVGRAPTPALVVAFTMTQPCARTRTWRHA